MPNVVTQTSLIQPSNGTTTGARIDYEMAKFRQNNGTVSVAISGPDGNPIQSSGAYVEGGTIATGTANLLLYRGTAGTLSIVGTQYPLPVQEQFAPVYEDNTAGVAAQNFKPVNSSTYAPSTDIDLYGASGTGKLVKNSAGNVYSVFVTSGTNAQRYFQLFNQSTVAVVGQTPVLSYPIGIGSVLSGDFAVLQLDNTHFSPSHYFSIGIAAAISSTPGTLGTASIGTAEHSWVIRYV